MKAATTQADFLQIEELAREIFHDFYYPQIAKDHIDFFLSEFQTAEKIEKQVQTNFEYYLFYQGKQVAGYLGLEFDKPKLILSKIYFLDEFRNSGFGAQALNQAIKRASEEQLDIIELFVNAKNKRAISFYEKNGFNPVKKVIHSYATQYAETDLLMRLEI